MSEASVRLESEGLGPSPALSRASFAKQALSVLVFTLVVILFGAVVRITGSGAGCGQHWPTCQGEIVHLPRKLATAIELTHRITSGASAILVFWLTVRAFRAFERGSVVRKAAVTASALMVVEALIGAVLVRLALVADNASAARAVVMSLHLVSTSALTASLALAVWWSLPRAAVLAGTARGLLRLTLACAGLVVLVSASGAVTALGDTVYPVRVSALGARIAEVESPSAHFLERLRVVHPILAVGAALALIALATRTSDRGLSRATRGFGKAVLGLSLTQVALGSLNVWLSAPGYLQVLHLLVASLLWLALVLLAAELAAPRSSA
ncbi:MAG TPA: COX15/CtaA family protein [Polyangiaceae bacterium]|nr:COX15/CtaA family protein [Polyangiaceae bacterium]